ncbi:MAG: hypothetical protein AAFP77_09375 [Bacteroidota bacterium]
MNALLKKLKEFLIFSVLSFLLVFPPLLSFYEEFQDKAFFWKLVFVLCGISILLAYYTESQEEE